MSAGGARVSAGCIRRLQPPACIPGSSRRRQRRAVACGARGREDKPLRRAVSSVGAVVLGLTLAVVGIEVAACSGSSSPPSKDMPNNEGAIPLCTDGGLQVAFSPMYSAYVPGHTFAIPALVVGSDGNVTWSADSKMVGMQTDSERPNEVLITALHA